MTAIIEQIDQLFAEWDTPETPGGVLAVIRGGEIIYSRAYGMADLERSVALTTDSVFDLGSTGKQFTAMLTALLNLQGNLSLDDPIRKYLPEMPAYADAITIRHLIHHTSGLRDYTTLMHLANLPFENLYVEDTFIDLIARQQAGNFAPGAEYVYSNTGYLLLGVIAQRVGGKSYPDLIREYILQPLGMTATSFNDSFKRIVKNRALAYEPTESGFATDISFCGGYGDGALISTVGDLFKWDQNFYHNILGGGQVLIDQVLTPGILNSGEAIEYAFGLMVSKRHGLQMVRHGGAWAGYRAEMIRFPERGLSVICLANRADANPSGKAQQVADLYLADDAAKSTASAVPGAAAAPGEIDTTGFLGAYRSLNGGSLVTLAAADAGLSLGLMGYTFPAEAVDTTRLKTIGAPIDIDITLLPKDQLSVSLQGGIPTVYRRLASAAETPDAGEYTGDYYSSELQISYRITGAGGPLSIKRGYAAPEPLTPAAPDLFAAGFLIFEFYREGGQVQGFDLFADRVINIRFQRRAAQS